MYDPNDFEDGWITSAQQAGKAVLLVCLIVIVFVGFCPLFFN